MKEEIITYHENADFDGSDIVVSRKELVRCKDCKHFDRFDGVIPWCSKWNNGSTTAPEGYCFLAERRDGQ